MTLKTQYLGIILAVCLVGCILISGCIGGSILFSKTGASREPETGITSWISAMNSKDIPQLYTLSPSIIRSNISEQDFVLANADNVLLKPGVVFSELEMLNKTSDGSRATITEWIAMDKPGEGRIPFFTRFTSFLKMANGKSGRMISDTWKGNAESCQLS